VNDFGPFDVALEELGPHRRMSAFHFVIGGFADGRAEATATGEVAVEAQLLGEHSREKRDFDRMSQHVLAVARAEGEPAHEVDQLFMQAVNARFLGSFLAETADVDLHFLLRSPTISSMREGWIRPS